MGPTLGPPVDRYARRREQGQKLAGSIQGFFEKQAEREAEDIENKAYEDEGLLLQGKRGKSRDMAIKGHNEGKLQKEIIGEKLRSEKAFDEYKRQKEQEEDFGLISEAVDHSEESPFNFKNPSSWNSKQIDKLRAIQPKTEKAKAVAKEAQQEYDRRQDLKKTREKVAPMLGALDVINEMKALRQKGNLGFGSASMGLVYPEARKDRAEYTQLGKSLIPYASMLNIRNQKEFETLAEKLYDPNIRDADAEGVLNAMTRIIENSMKAYSSEDTPSENAKQERPTITSFDR